LVLLIGHCDQPHSGLRYQAAWAIGWRGDFATAVTRGAFSTEVVCSLTMASISALRSLSFRARDLAIFFQSTFALSLGG
jgi:hypothetical protein